MFGTSLEQFRVTGRDLNENPAETVFRFGKISNANKLFKQHKYLTKCRKDPKNGKIVIIPAKDYRLITLNGRQRRDLMETYSIL